MKRLGIIISIGEHHKSMCGDEQIGKRCTDGLYANKFTVRREGHLERLACVRTEEEEISSFVFNLRSCGVKFMISWLCLIRLGRKLCGNADHVHNAVNRMSERGVRRRSSQTISVVFYSRGFVAFIRHC